MKHYLIPLSVAAFALATTARAEPRDIMVVMDVSGSMWGQIDGVTKIEIARDVFADVSQDWGTRDIAAGLIAYGHRRKGDCSDIELLAPVAPDSTARLGALVKGLTPRGKTPLSDAVRMAAEEMKFTEEAATVVLLTDGVETCNADPCALGAELERLGLDFTTHVIGFDIADPADKAQLQCLAASTGGRYLDSGDARALDGALRQVTAETEPEPQASSSYPVQIGLDYAPGTVRPQSVRFQARQPQTGEIRDLGTLNGTEEIVSGLATDLDEGQWMIEALSDEGRGSLEITHSAEQRIYIPFAAAPVEASFQDGSPYQLGAGLTVFLTATGVQAGAELPVALYDAAGTRLDWETRFGSDGEGLSVHDFESPQTAGTYRLVLGDPAAPIAERQIQVTQDALPEWRGARQGEPGGTLPTHFSGNTYYYNTITLSQGGTEVMSQQLGYAGAPLQLPDQPGVYDLSYTYADTSGTSQTADLGQITVGDGGTTTLPDDADAVAPPPGMAEAEPQPDGDTAQALDADAHGWEPASPAATAQAVLLRDADAEDVVFRCRKALCLYDDPATGATDIPILGDFTLLRPERRRSGQLFIEMVNEMNGEWVVLNPIRQTDMVTDCVGLGAEGWHGTSGAADTDMACTVKGANGYTARQMEALAMWATDRNAAAEQADRAAHDAAMGEDAPGTAPGPLQDNWTVTDAQTGTTLMRWQLMQDAGAPTAYVDLVGLPDTAFAGVAGSMGDTPSLTILSATDNGAPEAFQVNKPLSNGTLFGMFTRPGDWNGVEDAYTGMLQVSNAGQPVSATVRLTREGAAPAPTSAVPAEAATATGAVLDALSGGPESLLSDEANEVLNAFNGIEGMDALLSGEGGMAEVIDMLSDPEALDALTALGDRLDATEQEAAITYQVDLPADASGGTVEVFDGDDSLVTTWVAQPGTRLVDLPKARYTARWVAADGQTRALDLRPGARGDQ